MSARSIVVDASVARAASESGKPLPAACRDALQGIRDSSPTLEIDFSPALLQEWRDHRSFFAKKWLIAMYGRKRVRVRDADPPANAPLRAAMASLPARGQEALQKDLHLVEAALDGDERILSLDGVTMSILRDLRFRCSALAALHWAHPLEDAGVADWLSSGAPPRSSLRLDR